MKIKFAQSTPKPVENSFPSFFRFKKTGMVILAFNSNSAVVTEQGNGPWAVGHFDNDWADFNDKDHWEKTKGKVEFEQK